MLSSIRSAAAKLTPNIARTIPVRCLATSISSTSPHAATFGGSSKRHIQTETTGAPGGTSTSKIGEKMSMGMGTPSASSTNAPGAASSTINEHQPGVQHTAADVNKPSSSTNQGSGNKDKDKEQMTTSSGGENKGESRMTRGRSTPQLTTHDEEWPMLRGSNLYDPWRMFDDMSRHMMTPFMGGRGGITSPSLWSDPFHLMNQMDRYMDRAMQPVRAMVDRYSPRMELEEHEKEYLVHVHLPKGMKKDECRVNVEDNIMTISGRSSRRDRQTRLSNNFSRSITLPEHVDSEAIRAKWEDGELRIHLPKHPEAEEEAKKNEIKIE